MTGGSLGLGIRSGSYGSLDKQLQNGVSPILIVRKPSKMLKEKEKFLHWICKFAGRKKVGMLILSLISAAVFIWVLYVGKGEDAQEGNRVQNLSLNDSLSVINPESSPMYGVQRRNITSLYFQDLPMPPPPPVFFLGYTLPPGHPCNSFTLPPPPVDKKRTGPRPCSVCYLPVEEAIALMPKVLSPSPVLKNLTYIYEENLSRETEFGGSDFGGYPSLKQRADSYDIRESMNVHYLSGGVNLVKCLSCGNESNKVDEIMDISLDVILSNSIEDSLQRFFKPEILEGNNKYKCERKQMSIVQAPNILVIQLKRFEGSFGSKIDKAAGFKEFLLLSSFMCKTSQFYDLDLKTSELGICTFKGQCMGLHKKQCEMVASNLFTICVFIYLFYLFQK